MTQEAFAGVGAGATGGLKDHRRVGLVSRLHDRLNLLQVVDVESRDAVAVLGGVVEQEPKRDERHGEILEGWVVLDESGRYYRALRKSRALSSGLIACTATGHGFLKPGNIGVP